MPKTYPAQLFEESIVRTDTSPIRQGESGYDYLNRAAGDLADERRSRANQLFSAYPEGKAKFGMWSQVTAKRPDAFDEFMFELTVFAYLKANSVRVDEIEVPVQNGKAPDFQCSKDGVTFYVEVVTVHDMPAHLRELNKLQSDLQFLKSSGFHGHLTVRRYSDDQRLDEKRIRGELGCAIHVHRKLESFSYETFQIGWDLKFQLQKNTKARDHFLSSVFYGVRQVNIRERIVESLGQKCKRYGRLEHPLVVFVNIISPSPTALAHSLDAMYGNLAYMYDSLSEEGFMTGRWERTPTGVCQLSSGTSHLNSAVFFDSARGCDLVTPACLRIVNPHCEKTMPEVFSTTPTIRVLGDTREIVAEQPLAGGLSNNHRWFHALLNHSTERA